MMKKRYFGILLSGMLLAGCGNSGASQSVEVTKTCGADLGSVSTQFVFHAPAEDEELTSMEANITMPASTFGVDDLTDAESQAEEMKQEMAESLGVDADMLTVDIDSESIVITVNMKDAQTIRQYLDYAEDDSLIFNDVIEMVENSGIATCE